MSAAANPSITSEYAARTAASGSVTSPGASLIPSSTVSNTRSSDHYPRGPTTRRSGQVCGPARRRRVGYLSTLLACLAVITGCGAELDPIRGDEASAGETSVAYPTGSPERSLAQLDGGVGLVTDAEIRPYARVLDLLEGGCVEERMALADLAVYTVELAREANITTDTLSVMRDVQGAATVGEDEMDCQALFAAVLTILRSSAP